MRPARAAGPIGTPLPLETATNITDLVVSNPAHTDGLSQADSHMRLLKSTLKNTFPNFVSATGVQATQAQIDAAATGLVPHTFFAGTAALPGFTPAGDPNTGLFAPAADQLGVSLGGTQVLLMGGTALVTTLSITSTSGIAAAAIASVGAYSGGTGQLVPIGGTLLWWEDVLPTEGGYAWVNGQIIANANVVCPILLARWGSRFGGNGTTTMGVPDLRDTVPVGKSTMGAVASRALQTLTNTVLGTLLGLANTVLNIVNMPSHDHGGVTGDDTPDHVHVFQQAISNGVTYAPNAGSQTGYNGALGPVNTGGASTRHHHPIPAQGSATAFNNVQPSTTCNYILRLA